MVEKSPGSSTTLTALPSKGRCQGRQESKLIFYPEFEVQNFSSDSHLLPTSCVTWADQFTSLSFNTLIFKMGVLMTKSDSMSQIKHLTHCKVKVHIIFINNGIPMRPLTCCHGFKFVEEIISQVTLFTPNNQKVIFKNPLSQT